MKATDTIRAGDVIRIHYTTRSTTGCVMESSESREPLEFHAGSNEVVPGLTRSVLGMRLGDRKTVTVLPEDAFGYRDIHWQQSVPRAVLPERIDEGDQLAVTVGHQLLDIWVRGLTEHDAQLDANHPLAGETLVYDIHIVGHDQRRLDS